MKQKLEAIVFDADGTLLDTREFIYKAYEHTLLVCGHSIPSREVLKAHFALPIDECYAALAPGSDGGALRDVHRLFQENNLALVDSYEGLVDTLDTLRQSGLRIGIFSMRGSGVIATLEKVGIRDHCDAVVQGEDVKKHKPDPEGLHKVLRLMKVEPERAAMVGDMPIDIEAGKRGGVAYTIGVTHGFGTKAALEEAGADFIVERLPDIIPIVLPA